MIPLGWAALATAGAAAVAGALAGIGPPLAAALARRARWRLRCRRRPVPADGEPLTPDKARDLAAIACGLKAREAARSNGGRR